MSLTNERRQQIEREMVRALVAEAERHGWTPTGVDNGEEFEPCTEIADIIGHVFSVDMSSIHFTDGHSIAGVTAIRGNEGYTIFADWNTRMDTVLEALGPIIERYEEEDWA